MPDFETTVDDPDATNFRDEEGDIRYPNLVVQLVGGDGNAFAILGSVTRAMRHARVPQSEIDTFREEAMSGDYDHLLTTCMRWVDVE